MKPSNPKYRFKLVQTNRWWVVTELPTNITKYMSRTRMEALEYIQRKNAE